MLSPSPGGKTTGKCRWAGADKLKHIFLTDYMLGVEVKVDLVCDVY